MDVDESTRMLALSHRDYLIRRIELESAVEEQAVRLELAVETSVRCLDEAGMPIQGCQVAIFRGPWIPVLYNGSYKGDPTSRWPVWTSNTDEYGDANLRQLKPGEYSVCVTHPLFYQLDQEVGRLEVPSLRYVVTLRPTWGRVVEPPRGRVIRAMRVDLEAFGTQGAAQAMNAARAALRARFSGALAFAGMRIGSAQPAARVLAAFDDGTLGTAYVSMVELRSMETPVVLDQESPPRVASPVQFVVREREESVNGVRLAVYRTDLGLNWEVESGDSLALPGGEYEVESSLMSSAIDSALSKTRFRLSEYYAETRSVEIRLERPVARVRLELSTPHGPVDTLAGVTVQPEFGDSTTIVNWHSGCDRDPLVFDLPTGMVRIRVGAQHYAPLERNLELTPGGAETCLSLLLDYDNKNSK